MPKAVGIDLGTTNSVVAVLEAGDPVVIPNAEGGRTTPSVVAFAKNGEVLVGEVAKRQAITNPERTIRSVKRHMGTNWTIDIDGKDYTAQEISARILRKLKRDAEAYLGDTVTQAVITVPAYFDDAQRTATKEAGADRRPRGAAHHQRAHRGGAGLRPRQGGRRPDDPRLRPRRRHLRRVACSRSATACSRCKSTHGDTHLGGDDWDQRVIDWLVEQFKTAHGVDLSQGQHGRSSASRRPPRRPRSSCRQVQSDPDQPALHHRHRRGPAAPRRAAHPGQVPGAHRRPARAVPGARSSRPSRTPGITKGDIDHVILVGGSTRMPAVAELVKEMTGKEPNKGVNPDEVVAIGAAIQAGVLKGEVKDVLLLDVTPLSLGIETKGGGHDQAHRAQHHHPDQAHRGLHHRRGQPAVGRDPRAPGRARDGAVQQDARQVPARRPAAGAPRRARRSRSPSTSTPTASSTCRPRTGPPTRSSR